MLFGQLEIQAFTREMADSYRGIVATSGFSRPRILDRMIAATAIIDELPLITMTGGDFRNIPERTVKLRTD